MIADRYPLWSRWLALVFGGILGGLAGPTPGVPDEPGRACPSGNTAHGWEYARVCAALRSTDQSLPVDLDTGDA